MGTHKGLLPAPGRSDTLLESLVAAGREARLDVALVGDAAPYASLAPEVPRVEDRPPGSGPLGGLGGALDFAASESRGRIILVACDMPHVRAPILRTIAEHPSDAAVVAPRRTESAPWEPMLARYDVAQVAPVLDDALRRGTRSFQELFESMRIEALSVTGELNRALADWDTPADVTT
jgi:molybdopterin-guanine dinucleotide biosynthesis protein A